ncbi:MAG: hypothetical protein RIT45_2664 [Pseudomonadota bacterium]
MIRRTDAAATGRSSRHARSKLAFLGCGLVLALLGCEQARRALPGAPAVAPAPGAEDPNRVTDWASLPAEASATGIANALARLELQALAPVAAGTPARAAFDQGRWSEAARGLERLRADPGHAREARALTVMALVSRWHAGDNAVAAAGLDRFAASSDRIAPTCALWAAEAWLAAGDLERAAASLAKVPEQGFARADRRAWVAAQLATRRGVGAVAAWRAALKADTDPVADVLFAAAEAALAAGDAAAAEGWLREIRTRFPGGSADRDAQKRHAALAAEVRKPLTDAQRLVRLERARLLHKRELVLAESESLRKASPRGSETWCEATAIRARVLEIFWKRRKEAVATYAEAVAHCKGPSRAGLLYRAAQREANSGSGDRALSLFAEIEKQFPKSTLVDDAMRWRARILRGRKQHKAADAVLEAVLRHKGDMVEYAAWDLLWEAVSNRRWAVAERVGARVVAVAPAAERIFNRGRLHYWWARAAEELGRRKVAADRYAALVQRTPETYYGWLAAVRLHGLDPKRLARLEAQRQSGRGATAPEPPPARLLSDPHLLAAVDLLRMGMDSSARAEIAAVAWPKGEAADRVRAALWTSVGAYNRALAALADVDLGGVSPRHGLFTLVYPRPDAFRPIVAKTARAQGVDPDFVWAIMRTESRFSPTVQSPVLATGLLQLMLPTATAMNARLGVVDKISYASLKRPEVNIPLGVGYMARLRKRWDGADALVASSYNAGPGNARKWLRERHDWPLDAFVEAIPFRENRRYVKSVLTSWRHYGALRGAGRPALSLRLPGAGAEESDD